MSRVRVALTFEQCWRESPGGTGVAAVELGRALAARDDMKVIGVAGRHRRAATAGYEPTVAVAQLPLAGPLLVESSLRFGWPRIERATGPVDVLHATSIIPFASAPQVPLVKRRRQTRGGDAPAAWHAADNRPERALHDREGGERPLAARAPVRDMSSKKAFACFNSTVTSSAALRQSTSLSSTTLDATPCATPPLRTSA
jgi:hypothetical protein